MKQQGNKLSQFWQELIRTKVVCVITVYATTAFADLELVTNIADPVGLTDKTMKIDFLLDIPLGMIFQYCD
jgi:hypothetical protein